MEDPEFWPEEIFSNHPVFFNQDNQAIILVGTEFIPLNIRILKTTISKEIRLILLENGHLWQIKLRGEPPRRLNVNFKIVDFISLTIAFLILDENGTLYRIDEGRPEVVKQNVLSIPSSSNSTSIVLNVPNGVSYTYVFTGSRGYRKLKIPYVKSYVQSRKFLVMVTETEQVFMMVQRGDNIEGFLLNEREVYDESELLPESKGDSLLLHLTSLDGVRNIAGGSAIFPGDQFGIYKRYLAYLMPNGELAYSYYDNDGNQRGVYDDTNFTDLISINSNIYLQNSDGQIFCYRGPVTDEIQVLNNPEPLSLHRREIHVPIKSARI